MKVLNLSAIWGPNNAYNYRRWVKGRKENRKLKKCFIGTILLLNLFLSGESVVMWPAAGEGKLMDGEFWRTHVLRELMPYWFDHVIDEEYGAFYMNLSRDWQPGPPWDKVPAMISRQIFSFSTAYLLSGEDKYLEVARNAVDYLLKHGWDNEYGGWFGSITQEGKPNDTSKTVSYQLYTNVGLTQYYFITGDERVLSHVLKSVEIRKTYAHDNVFDGYFQTLNRDLSIRDSSKAKHSHYGYVSSLMLNLYLAVQDKDLRKFAEHMTDLSIKYMMDPEEGWILGYPTKFDRKWNFTPYMKDGKEMVYIGASLTAALSFLRLYHLTNNATYLKHGRMLGDKINRCAWDPDLCVWYNFIEKIHPYRPETAPVIPWWVHIYGSFLQLQLYNVTKDEQYLKRFRKSELFFNQHFIDHEYGGVFASVSPDGSLIGDGRKAAVWQTSYHEVEHGLLNYLYLNLYVNGRPVVLHFKLDGAESPKKHYISLADDPSVSVTAIRINGKPWAAFDARERYVILPAGKNLDVEVTLSPEPLSAPYLSNSEVPLHSAVTTDNSLSFEASPIEHQGKISIYVPWDSFSIDVGGHCRAIVRDGRLSKEEWTYDRVKKILRITMPSSKEVGVLSLMNFCIRKEK